MVMLYTNIFCIPHVYAIPFLKYPIKRKLNSTWNLLNSESRAWAKWNDRYNQSKIKVFLPHQI